MPEYKSPTPNQSIGPIKNDSWRSRLARALMGNSESFGRQQFVEGMLGSDGLGSSGAGLVDFVPGGQVFAAQEALAAGDPQSAAIAIMPAAPKAKQLGKALKAKPRIGVDTPAPYPQYAERYPEVPPPVMKPKEKPSYPGEMYAAKGETPETKAFMKTRQQIQKQMDAEGFDPYFPPEQRFDVDPSHYPAQGDTMTVTAKTEAGRAPHEALTMHPDTLARLEAAYARGQEIPGAEKWYLMGQLEKAYIDELGEEAGRKAFAKRFAGSMAATTGGADPTGNLLAAHYGNYLKTHGLPVPSSASEVPHPVGGRYLSGNLKLQDNYWNQDLAMPYDTMPKRHNFQMNFLGHKDRGTIDEQMMSEIVPGGPQAPPSGHYGSYEKPVQYLAAQHGIGARDFQDVTWGGIKSAKTGGQFAAGKPMIQTVNEAIERTHRMTGMPRDEIVRRGLIRGEIPLYGMGGAALGAALMQQQPEE